MRPRNAKQRILFSVFRILDFSPSSFPNSSSLDLFFLVPKLSLWVHFLFPVRPTAPWLWVGRFFFLVIPQGLFPFFFSFALALRLSGLVFGTFLSLDLCASRCHFIFSRVHHRFRSCSGDFVNPFLRLILWPPPSVGHPIYRFIFHGLPAYTWLEFPSKAGLVPLRDFFRFLFVSFMSVLPFVSAQFFFPCSSVFFEDSKNRTPPTPVFLARRFLSRWHTSFFSEVAFFCGFFLVSRL